MKTQVSRRLGAIAFSRPMPALLVVLAVVTVPNPAWSVDLKLVVGQQQGGLPSAQWLAAARYFNDEDTIATLARTPQPLSETDKAWLALIADRLERWTAAAPDLLAPFDDIAAPEALTVLVGNVATSDAFVAADTTIAFNVARLRAVYGDAADAANADRIDRFFSHEYTHVLHRIWQREHGLVVRTPLERALWASLKEGVGNFYSLSSRWRADDGTLSAHAREVLDRLAPTFVERLRALASASDDEAERLMQGLSMGPFEEKWGALPVALWLTAETGNDPQALGAWIARGPGGVLTLAHKYLPGELALQLPADPFMH